MNLESKSIGACLGATLLSVTAMATKPCIPADPKIEAQVESKLKKMTLDEKVGQMCELTIESVTDYEATKESGKFAFSSKLDEAIGTFKIGSILNTPMGRAQRPEVFAEIIKVIQEKSMKSMGIPTVYGIDNNHGTSYVDGGTLFPQPINQAASFNSEIPLRACEICSYETRAASIPWIYTPTLDLARGSSWPRMWESYGEDPLVNAVMGAQAVRGFQGDDPNHVDARHCAVSMKHYMAYGAAVNGLDRTPSSVTDRDMREKYFAPFLAAARAGALTVMVNSAINNGIPFHANHEYITVWLKEQLNWDGMVVTDWADINNLYTRDHIAADKKDAIRIAINAGIDMAMEPYETDFCTLLKVLVEEGEVPMSRIDDAVRRILRLKYRLNLFDKPYNKVKDYPKFGSREHADFATRAAEECEVLLKNDGNLLPLKKGTKILVTGPNANAMRCLNGGWSYTWQGHKADEFAQQYNTIYEAMCNKFGSENVVLEQGVKYLPTIDSNNNWRDDNADELGKAVAAAQNVDVVVACIGENSYCETPGNIKDMRLSANQRNLVKALAATGKPVVLILNEGRPRVISDIVPLAKAIVNIMLPGNYGADALANLLAGDANFSAKMPMTYPSSVNAFATYDYKPCENVATMSGTYDYDAQIYVQWQFGEGMSYTTFNYSNLRVDKSEFTATDDLTFTVDVTNTGKVAGKEPVLLFVSDLVASISPDIRRLRAFTKIDLKPGETRTVKLTVKAQDLAFVGADLKWILEKGDFTATCGTEKVSLKCTKTHRWDTPNKD